MAPHPEAAQWGPDSVSAGDAGALAYRASTAAALDADFDYGEDDDEEGVLPPLPPDALALPPQSQPSATAAVQAAAMTAGGSSSSSSSSTATPATQWRAGTSPPATLAALPAPAAAAAAVTVYKDGRLDVSAALVADLASLPPQVPPQAAGPPGSATAATAAPQPAAARRAALPAVGIRTGPGLPRPPFSSTPPRLSVPPAMALAIEAVVAATATAQRLSPAAAATLGTAMLLHTSARPRAAARLARETLAAPHRMRLFDYFLVLGRGEIDPELDRVPDVRPAGPGVHSRPCWPGCRVRTGRRPHCPTASPCSAFPDRLAAVGRAPAAHRAALCADVRGRRQAALHRPGEVGGVAAPGLGCHVRCARDGCARAAGRGRW